MVSIIVNYCGLFELFLSCGLALPDSSSHINAAEAIRPSAKCWWFGCNVGLLKRKLCDRWCCRCWKGLYITVSQSSKLLPLVILLAVRSILVPYIRIIHIFFDLVSPLLAHIFEDSLFNFCHATSLILVQGCSLVLMIWIHVWIFILQMNYEDFCHIASVCTEQIGPKCRRFFSPSNFMKFEKDESGRIAILPFYLYVMRTVGLLSFIRNVIVALWNFLTLLFGK